MNKNKIIIITTILFIIIPLLIKEKPIETRKNNQSIINQKENKELNVLLFNNDFNSYSGTIVGSKTKVLIDKINNKNENNKEHQITIYYNKIKYNDIDKLKKKINDISNYKVTYKYDEEGYVINVIITK